MTPAGGDALSHDVFAGAAAKSQPKEANLSPMFCASAPGRRRLTAKPAPRLPHGAARRRRYYLQRPRSYHRDIFDYQHNNVI